MQGARCMDCGTPFCHSGLSGLACADQLNRAGHKVTVLERSDRIGGLLILWSLKYGS